MHTEDLLRDPSQVKEITDHGLIAFCWGDDNNDTGTIRYLKELGMHGVVYDRINDHIPQKKSIFFTEHQYELLQIAVQSPEAEINPESVLESLQQDSESDKNSSSDSVSPERLAAEQSFLEQSKNGLELEQC